MDSRSQYSCALLTHPPPNNESSLEVPKHEKCPFRLDRQMVCWKKQSYISKNKSRTTYGNGKLVEIFFFGWWLPVAPGGAWWRPVAHNTFRSCIHRQRFRIPLLACLVWFPVLLCRVPLVASPTCLASQRWQSFLLRQCPLLAPLPRRGIQPLMFTAVITGGWLGCHPPPPPPLATLCRHR
jgi:hypothetical protein